MATSKAERRGKCPSNAEQHEHMAMRQRQNLSTALRNPNENWMANILDGTGYKWTRQARWGWRLFDFWCHELGVAVEVDGPEHDGVRDAVIDDYQYRRSGILVLRVRNKNMEDALLAVETVNSVCSWQQRREGREHG